MDVDNQEKTGYMKTELISVSEVHPSRMHDNMLPMSPDDYKALAQYVSPRDITAVSDNLIWGFGDLDVQMGSEFQAEN
ncbi:signal transducer and activator of transcription 1-like [Brachionichthys hirsutus]|uniref:signal transducer and activator of transcription 1-like n=1 Tax=Brachionichthys hirsutus TaxID=412623 RepID=UPI0036053A36